MSTDSAAGSALAPRVRAFVAGIRWFVRGVVREDAYERYVAHARRQHPDAAVPTVKEFWRDTYAEMDRNPGARCC